MKVFNLLVLFGVFVVICWSCSVKNTEEPLVFNFGTQEGRDIFNQLDNDSLYTNLIGTEKDEAEADTLYQRWLGFNKELAKTVKSNNFNWNTKDSAVILWNRVYCNGKGEIEYYLYMIRNENVSEETAKAYGDFIKTQLPNLKYDVQREYKYAQCGSFRHYVY